MRLLNFKSCNTLILFLASLICKAIYEDQPTVVSFSEALGRGSQSPPPLFFFHHMFHQIPTPEEFYANQLNFCADSISNIHITHRIRVARTRWRRAGFNFLQGEKHTSYQNHVISKLRLQYLVIIQFRELKKNLMLTALFILFKFSPLWISPFTRQKGGNFKKKF